MLNQAAVNAILAANFSDDRIYAIQSFITDLIERKKYGGGVNQYRIKNTNDGTYITDLAGFVSNIDPTKLEAKYNYLNDKLSGDRTHPFTVTIGNYIVELSDLTTEDEIYTEMFGNDKKVIKFFLNYLADGDTVLPIKIFQVKLTS